MHFVDRQLRKHRFGALQPRLAYHKYPRFHPGVWSRRQWKPSCRLLSQPGHEDRFLLARLLLSQYLVSPQSGFGRWGNLYSIATQLRWRRRIFLQLPGTTAANDYAVTHPGNYAKWSGNHDNGDIDGSVQHDVVCKLFVWRHLGGLDTSRGHLSNQCHASVGHQLPRPNPELYAVQCHRQLQHCHSDANTDRRHLAHGARVNDDYFDCNRRFGQYQLMQFYANCDCSKHFGYHHFEHLQSLCGRHRDNDSDLGNRLPLEQWEHNRLHHCHNHGMVLGGCDLGPRLYCKGLDLYYLPTWTSTYLVSGWKPSLYRHVSQLPMVPECVPLPILERMFL